MPANAPCLAIDVAGAGVMPPSPYFPGHAFMKHSAPFDGTSQIKGRNMAVKSVALVAHDNKKKELVDWANENRTRLAPLQPPPAPLAPSTLIGAHAPLRHGVSSSTRCEGAGEV